MRPRAVNDGRSLRRALVFASISLLGAIAVVAGGTSAAGPAPADGPVVIADGHFDIAPRIVDGTWLIGIRDDRVSPAVWRDPADVVIHVGPAGRRALPEDGGGSLLGDPGTVVWLLSQVQEPDLPWPGWNTEDSSVRESITGNIDWSLENHDGPGAFVLFLVGTLGAFETLFDSRAALPQWTSLRPAIHAHGTWAFTEAGIHRLTFGMRAFDQDGRSRWAEATLVVAVGDADPTQALRPTAPGVSPIQDVAGSSPDTVGHEVRPADGDVVGGPATPVIVIAILGMLAATVLLGRARRRRTRHRPAAALGESEPETTRR